MALKQILKSEQNCKLIVTTIRRIFLKGIEPNSYFQQNSFKLYFNNWFSNHTKLLLIIEYSILFDYVIVTFEHLDKLHECIISNSTYLSSVINHVELQEISDIITQNQ